MRRTTENPMVVLLLNRHCPEQWQSELESLGDVRF